VAVGVLKKAGGEIVCARCEIADSPLQRMRGLLGRDGLEPDQGMLFRPAGSIHMFFMRFPIDAVFCDRDLVVLGVERDLRPWRTAGRKGAKVVVELAAGAASGLAPGDRLFLDTMTPRERRSRSSSKAPFPPPRRSTSSTGPGAAIISRSPSTTRPSTASPASSSTS
jgi:uncharacterized membrane protein (UPF0127 family)